MGRSLLIEYTEVLSRGTYERWHKDSFLNEETLHVVCHKRKRFIIGTRQKITVAELKTQGFKKIWESS